VFARAPGVAKKSPAAEKLNLRTRAEIVRFASAQGWLEEIVKEPNSEATSCGHYYGYRLIKTRRAEIPVR